ncbi:hypothetical protein SLEP1_g46770 [Rubroshorea leprosula]|uniref:SRP54-type proteins GTP-binding domain-containing protein n=1 Tax=Rubroshorea leprosula TaxID=152421 RepID=A0AAV5LQT4_9ROSI|nr:hypothetical protein SLEP1_g46770 [Rubroshorea leprosula]
MLLICIDCPPCSVSFDSTDSFVACNRWGVPVYTAGTDVKPSEIARQGLEEAKKKNIDVVIMDTAGRIQIDKAMMDELRKVKLVLNPIEVLLVADAILGQEAACT